MRHGTEMEVEACYVDTHGQSFIGFGITRLLGFDLLSGSSRSTGASSTSRPRATWTATPGCGPR
jgi:hypothetical protein